MAFCSNCGQELEDGVKFCSNCGVAVNSNSTSQRKMVYEGEMHKCPNCGEILKSFTTSCPACGYEPRSVKTNSPVEELVKKIENASSLNEKIELIANFYIPNTKEDIYDFFILAVSNLEDKYYDTDDAWRAKLEQAYHKAKLSFGNTSEFEYLDDLYKKTVKEVDRRERSISTIYRRNKKTFIITIMAIVGVFMLALGVIGVCFEEYGFAGFVLISFSFLDLCSIPLVPNLIRDESTETNKVQNNSLSKSNTKRILIGYDYSEFIGQNYEDIVETLRELGFKNFETKPVKKKLTEKEGEIKGISISGRTEFYSDDYFNSTGKVIIRYCSKNV